MNVCCLYNVLCSYQIFMKELKIVGVNINPFAFPRALELVRAMADRYLQYDKLNIRLYELRDYKVALETLRKGEISKAVFKC